MDIMDQTIILDCQTKSDLPCCESCIIYQQCKTKKKANEKDECFLEIGTIAH